MNHHIISLREMLSDTGTNDRKFKTIGLEPKILNINVQNSSIYLVFRISKTIYSY